MSRYLTGSVMAAVLFWGAGCYTMIRGPKPMAIGANRSANIVHQHAPSKLITDEPVANSNRAKSAEEKDRTQLVEDDPEVVDLGDFRDSRDVNAFADPFLSQETRRASTFDTYDPLQPSLRNPRSYARGYYDPYTGLLYNPYYGSSIPFNGYGAGPYGTGAGPYVGYDPYTGAPVTGFVWVDESNTVKPTNQSEAIASTPGTVPAPAPSGLVVAQPQPSAAERSWQRGVWRQPYGAVGRSMGSTPDGRGAGGPSARPVASGGGNGRGGSPAGHSGSGARNHGGRVK